MDSILPKDRLALKRIDAYIKRIYNSNGIILLGVDSKNQADEFVKYLTQKHNLKTYEYQDEILSILAYDDSYNKDNFFIANIYERENQQTIIDHLQFQRDHIPFSNIKIIVILPNESLEYLKMEASDLFSTVKFSYSFSDHSVDNKFEEKNEKLNDAIKNYEEYLKGDIQHDNIIATLTVAIINEAYKISSYHTALKYTVIALKYAKDINNKAKLYSILGNVYNEISEYDKSTKYSNKLLKIAEKYNFKDAEATANQNLGNAYRSLNELTTALSYYENSLKINKEIGNKEGISSSLGNIGVIYQESSNYEKALKYHNNSLKIQKEIGNKNGIACSFKNIGNVYYKLDDYDKALKYQNDSLLIYKEIGNKNAIADLFNNIGNIYYKLDDYDKGLKYQNDSLSIKKEIEKEIEDLKI